MSLFVTLFTHSHSTLTKNRYRERIYKLLHLCLLSSHLPAYLVAAFLKRLARLSLTAPPTGTLFVIPLIYNMLKRHPQCEPLIQRGRLGALSTTSDNTTTSDATVSTTISDSPTSISNAFASTTTFTSSNNRLPRNCQPIQRRSIANTSYITCYNYWLPRNCQPTQR